MGWYVLNGHEPIPVDDVIEWAKWFEKGDRRVAKTSIEPNVFVSTVFLGLDHSFMEGRPILFETMVFGDGEEDTMMERYSTWDEAEKGHKDMIERVKEIIKKREPS